MKPTVPTKRIAVIPGDGIGLEVIPAAIRVVDACAKRHGFELQYHEFDWGSERYARDGAMMPGDGIDQLAHFDAILLGAVGSPEVPDAASLWGLLIPIRRSFSQYVNLRPIRRFEGIQGPLRTTAPIDLVVVRENTEGEYSDVGGRFLRGTPQESAIQQSIFTRLGIERIADHAFEQATGRRCHLTSATKSNGIIHTLPFWDEVVRERAAHHPKVELEHEHIDALCAKLVLNPERYDVIVASNLFGDILSDLAAAVSGSIGIAPSANLDPSREHPSMFEPVHGSAPDIAGAGTANPLGAIWSAALMLEHLGHQQAAKEIVAAIGATVAVPESRTRDLGGRADTEEATAAILGHLR